MKVLVTGGAGFIGSNLIDELINQDYDVVCLDRNKDGHWNKQATNYVGDVCDLPLVCELMSDVDYVFHLAADVQIQETIHNPIGCYQNNVIGTATALEAAKQSGVKKFIFSSTSAIYKSGWMVQSEGSPEDPCLNPYASSKKCGEDMCGVYSNLYDLHTVSLRYFNVYGDRQHSTGQYAPVLGVFMKMRNGGNPLTITGDGSQRRDFVNVKDVAKANILAATNCETTGEFYNVGSGDNFSVQEIADMISTNQTYIDKRPGEVQETKAVLAKIEKDLEWEPTVNLKNWLLEVN